MHLINAEKYYYFLWDVVPITQLCPVGSVVLEDEGNQP